MTLDLPGTQHALSPGGRHVDRSEEHDMPHDSRFTAPKGILLAALLGLAALAVPSVATSQARGTLQVTATVVNTEPAFAGLAAATVAASAWATTGKTVTNDVSTVAQVTISHDAAVPSSGTQPAAALVVEIAYQN